MFQTTRFPLRQNNIDKTADLSFSKPKQIFSLSLLNMLMLSKINQKNSQQLKSLHYQWRNKSRRHSRIQYRHRMSFNLTPYKAFFFLFNTITTTTITLSIREKKNGKRTWFPCTQDHFTQIHHDHSFWKRKKNIHSQKRRTSEGTNDSLLSFCLHFKNFYLFFFSSKN